jgi:hypothetical protein
VHPFGQLLGPASTCCMYSKFWYPVSDVLAAMGPPVFMSQGTYTTLYPVGGFRSQEPWKDTNAEPFQEQGNDPHSFAPEEFEHVEDEG